MNSSGAAFCLRRWVVPRASLRLPAEPAPACVVVVVSMIMIAVTFLVVVVSMIMIAVTFNVVIAIRA